MFVPVHVTPTPGRYRANRAGEPNTYERRIFDVLAFGTDADGHTGAMVLVGNKPEWHPAEAWTIWGSR